MILDTLMLVIVGLAAIPITIRRLYKRRQENTGQRCWYCGHDLRRVSKMAGREHPAHCPQCGHEVESDS